MNLAARLAARAAEGRPVRAALIGSGTSITAVTTDERPPRGARARELAGWALVPVLAIASARTR